MKAFSFLAVSKAAGLGLMFSLWLGFGPAPLQAQRMFITPDNLTPEALMKAYALNFSEADVKYTGKLVILTGRLRIAQPANHPYQRDDLPYAVMEAPGFQPVAIYFWNWEAEKMRTMPSGNLISVMGFCQGVFPQMSLVGACFYPRGCGGPVENFQGPHFKTPPTPRRVLPK